MSHVTMGGKACYGEAASNWNNNIIYHDGKLYLILRGLIACMLTQEQFLELIKSVFQGLFWKGYASEICLDMENSV